MIDIHIHLEEPESDPQALLDKFDSTDIDSGVILSLPPETFYTESESYDPETRLKQLQTYCANDRLYPFFWIDPIADDAEEQVDKALAYNVAGFKIICDRFYPSHEKAMNTYRKIAKANKPILFHSGILWDGKVSSKYNHPIEFECLLEVPKLKFAMAHISWPWCDELIALYGKFLNAFSLNPDLSVEMFIDTTPGTPPIYRKEALTRLYTVGYDIEHNIMFGSDTLANNYNTTGVATWRKRDTEILTELGLSNAQQECYFTTNCQRFLGLLPNSGIKKKLPVSGE
jgi:predicted TIM-barrel fold metal-dependent hydrolase